MNASDARTSEQSAQSSRTRRVAQPSNPSARYETPNEEEELLNDALNSAHTAVKKLDRHAQISAEYNKRNSAAASYLTPSSSAHRSGVAFGQSQGTATTQPVEIARTHVPKEDGPAKWPTPPYESDWGTSVAASLMVTQSQYR